MNPLSPNARMNRVRNEVKAIRAAWPEADTTVAGDGLSAVVIIGHQASTTIIEVTPDASRQLHVCHGFPSTPRWMDGWDD